MFPIHPAQAVQEQKDEADFESPVARVGVTSKDKDRQCGGYQRAQNTQLRIP